LSFYVIRGDAICYITAASGMQTHENSRLVCW
jgi:hypothetical protein